MRRVALFLLIAAVGATMAALARIPRPAAAQRGLPLPTGKYLAPTGTHTEVGSYPVNMTLTPDGKFVIVTNSGFRQQLSVLDAESGKLVHRVVSNQKERSRDLDCLYYGVSADRVGDYEPENIVYASRGSDSRVDAFKLSQTGHLELDEPLSKRLTIPSMAKTPACIAGVSGTTKPHGVSSVLAVDNESYASDGFRGRLHYFNLSENKHWVIEVPAFPLAVARIRLEPKAYVTSERDGTVSAVDLQAHRVSKTVRTGEQPSYLLLNKAQDRLFVSNAGSDTVSVLDTKTDRVLQTILVRPAEARGLPGCSPLGMALSADEKRLFVAVAEMNAVAVLDLKKGEVLGYIPVGWHPTSVIVSHDGHRMFVANAKGTVVRNPNSSKVRSVGQYIQDIIEGSVSVIDLPRAEDRLTHLTREALTANRLGTAPAPGPKFENPGIKHVIYIIKENRTYDNVLGDLPRGNGDPAICLFPRKITPNQHALAERFVLLDNFHCCAEVSADGWNWSTAGMVSEYTSRNTPYNYSGRGRDYDFEGSTNGVAVDLQGIRDVARPPGGYIWDACAKAGVSFRNYGFFVGDVDALGAKRASLAKADNAPSKRALLGVTDDNFRQYDLRYADSEAWIAHKAASPTQIRAYGDFKAPSRFTEWKREFDRYVRDRNLPRFTMLRFPRNHTSGTRAGEPTPQAMVADNDYAVGQVVEAVSHSPYWRSTVICILEDDAQGGYDHVDAHRSPALVISPYIRPGTIDSRFYNTDSMLKTMELLLGLKPMTQYDAIADPIDVFTAGDGNAAPYKAILPAREIVAAINSPTAYRAADSKRLMNRFQEESMPDDELNDILWGAIKGPVARPHTKNAEKD